jgi:hypothetical protein
MTDDDHDQFLALCKPHRPRNFPTPRSRRRRLATRIGSTGRADAGLHCRASTSRSYHHSALNELRHTAGKATHFAGCRRSLKQDPAAR